MAMTAADAREYQQGEVVVVRFDLTSNPGPWSQFITYATNDLAKYANKTWKALQTSTGQTPAENAYWTVNPGRINPATIYFIVQPPGLDPETHTLNSVGTILEMVGDGVLEATIDTSPAAGAWKAELYVPGYTATPWFAKVTRAATDLP